MDRIQAQNAQYKNALLDVEGTITDDDLRKMKFKCDQIIKKAESQKIVSATQLFTALEQRDYLGQTNLEFLKELLRTCCSGRTDGLRLIEAYERSQGIQGRIPQVQDTLHGAHVGGPVPGLGTAQPQVIYVLQNGNQQQMGIPTQQNRLPRYDGPDLSNEMNFLSKSLARDWRFYIRALGVSEDDIDTVACDYRTTRERIHQCLLLWQQQEQHNASRQKLIDALRHSSVQRNDLASKLEAGQA